MGGESRTHKTLNLATTEPEPIILPGLPNELALLCLARLPLGRHPHGRCVSRAWRLALQPSSIDPLRRSLGITQEFVCISLLKVPEVPEEEQPDFTGITYAWLLLDPLLLCCYVIPNPPVRTCWGYDDPAGVQGIAAGKDLLVVGTDETNPRADSEIFRFDVINRQWCLVAAAEEYDRRWFASGMLDDFVYVAGGHIAGNTSARLCCALRFNMRSRQAEMLPEMSEVRELCSGFIMDGCFYVMGGYCDMWTVHNSGEFFDPRTGVWTLVPNMWPKEMAAEIGSTTAPSVAIVNGQLYALKSRSREIMRYEKLTNTWDSMGYVPAVEGCNCDSGGHRIIGVGEEIWFILNDWKCKISILASKPKAGLASNSLTWRPLPFELEQEFPGVSSCTVLRV